jgi:tetratricopeptide (TPR) repeat protein
MTDTSANSLSLRDRYQATIDDIVERILAGKQIISKEYIYQTLADSIVPGTSEIVEGCINDRIQVCQQEIDRQSNKVKQAKIGHRVNALENIKTVLGKWQLDRQSSIAVAETTDLIINSDPPTRLSILLQIIDRNRSHPFSLIQIESLGRSLETAIETNPHLEAPEQIQQLAMGIERGLISLDNLQPHLISWIYEGQSKIGFGDRLDHNPWHIWSKPISNPLARELFDTIAARNPIEDLIAERAGSYWDDWIELALILQGLQSGLSNWCRNQMYDLDWGKQMSVSIPITFAGVWCEIANGLERSSKLGLNERSNLRDACFEVTLQLLFTTAQQEYFPLYGGIFASFSGNSLKHTLEYFDRPLKQVEGTQEKGRLLTILGYSQQIIGSLDRAVKLHSEAMEIANRAGDTVCEIANINHLARIAIAGRAFPQAIDLSQRALISARQTGDRRGEANALINYGYAHVISAHALDRLTPEIAEENISYLDRGLDLARSLDDNRSSGLAAYSLGLAYLTLEQPEKAIEYFQSGLRSAQAVGDLYLQGVTLLYLAEAHYSWEKYKTAVYYGCLAMYLLAEIEAKETRQAIDLVKIVHGKQGDRWFEDLLVEYRDRLISIIGVDGWDELPNLWG